MTTNLLDFRPPPDPLIRRPGRWPLGSRLLLAAASAWATPLAWGQATASLGSAAAIPPPIFAASDSPPVNLDPMTVHSPKLPGLLGRIFGSSWNVSECTQGSNFHLRRGELVDAIGFRHQYLAQHPGEQAIVVVLTGPTDNRVTQAVVAYSDHRRIHFESAALGDIQPSGFTVDDLAHPERFRHYLQAQRDALTEEIGSDNTILGTDQSAIDRAANPSVLSADALTVVPMSALLAAAEETGDYSHLTMFDQPLYRGSSDDMLISAYYWLNDQDKVGLIPVSRGPVRVQLTSGPAVLRDAVVFDWAGTHYLYSDRDGMLALPFPRDPITGQPYLVVQNGDGLECLYFLAAYAKQHPAESVALVPPLDGVHAAAVFTRGGKLWMMSPYLGQFALPVRFKIDQIDRLARLHETLIAHEAKKLGAGVSRPPTAIPESLPGDTISEQLRRAYLAFRDLGVPVKFVADRQQLPGLQVDFAQSEYSYYSNTPPSANVPTG